MSNIEKIRELLGNAGWAKGEAFDLMDHADKEFYEAARNMIPALIAVVEAAELMRSLQKRGARDPSEHAMIADSAGKLDRAIAKLEGGKE